MFPSMNDKFKMTQNDSFKERIRGLEEIINSRGNTTVFASKSENGKLSRNWNYVGCPALRQASRGSRTGFPKGFWQNSQRKRSTLPFLFERNGTYSTFQYSRVKLRKQPIHKALPTVQNGNISSNISANIQPYGSLPSFAQLPDINNQEHRKDIIEHQSYQTINSPDRVNKNSSNFLSHNKNSYPDVSVVTNVEKSAIKLKNTENTSPGDNLIGEFVNKSPHVDNLTGQHVNQKQHADVVPKIQNQDNLDISEVTAPVHGNHQENGIQEYHTNSDETPIDKRRDSIDPQLELKDPDIHNRDNYVVSSADHSENLSVIPERSHVENNTSGTTSVENGDGDKISDTGCEVSREIVTNKHEEIYGNNNNIQTKDKGKTTSPAGDAVVNKSDVILNKHPNDSHGTTYIKDPILCEKTHVENIIADSTKEPTEATRLELLSGSLANIPPPRSNVVRIFLSSTFSDTKEERNYLAKHAYPVLEEFCSGIGLEFQVVDMRWGVTMEATLEHFTSALCVQQVDLCARISRGPCFVALIGQRYGYQSPVVEVDKDEMELILEVCDTRSDLEASLLRTWYKLDENNVPPKYVILKPQYVYDQYQCSGSNPYNSPLEAWDTEGVKIQQILKLGAQICVENNSMTKDKMTKYDISVTEQEIRRALTLGVTNRMLCYQRTLKAIDLTDQLAQKFIHTSKQDGHLVVDKCIVDKLQNIKSNIRDAVCSENIKSYEAVWTEKGIDAENCIDNKVYLEQLCADFITDIQRIIKEENNNSKPEDPLVKEVAHHLRLVNLKTECFCGKHTLLQQLKDKILDANTDTPITLYGKSGAGKTSVMSMIHKNAKEWFGEESVVITRFLGTSPASTKIFRTIESICSQLHSVYNIGMPDSEEIETPSKLYQYFINLLDIISEGMGAEKPLVILLDSIDQLAPYDAAYSLSWLPRKVPANVRIVVSTLPEEHDILFNLEKIFSEKECMFETEGLSDFTLDELLGAYLSKDNRMVTNEQKQKIESILAENKHALFLRLLMVEASKWTSFQPIFEFPNTTQGALDLLFKQLENRFGVVLVSHTSTLLAISREGLSEREIEDALSLDDRVLDSVYEFHDPPIEGEVFIPPLLWARLRHGMDNYLVEKDAHGVTVVTWYHRLFLEFVIKRYSNVETYGEVVKECFENLKHLFTHDGSVYRTLHLSKRGKSLVDVKRVVTHHPTSTTGSRKLMFLPYILSKSDISMFKESLLFNVHWLKTKLNATSLKSVLYDFEMIHSDTEVEFLRETLKLSSSGLENHSERNLLEQEILARIPYGYQGMPLVKKLVKHCLNSLQTECQQSANPIFIPVSPCLYLPNGTLKTSINGPTAVENVYDNNILVTKGLSTGIQVWDITNNECLKFITPVTDIEHVITTKDKQIIHTEDTFLKIYDIDSGSLTTKLNILPHVTSKENQGLVGRPYLDVLSLSDSGELCVVRANKPDMIKNNQSLFLCNLVSTEIKGLSINVDYQNGGVFCADKIANAIFIQNDTQLVLTLNSPEVIFCLNIHDGAKVCEIPLQNQSVRFVSFRTARIHSAEGSKLVFACHPDGLVLFDENERTIIKQPPPVKVVQRSIKLTQICCRQSTVFVLLLRIKDRSCFLNVYNDQLESIDEYLTNTEIPSAFEVSSNALVAAIGYVPVGIVEIWNLETKTMLQNIKSHSGMVTSLKFIKNCRELVSASVDYSIKIWRISDNVELTSENLVENKSEFDTIKPGASNYRKIKELCLDVSQVEMLKDSKQMLTSFESRHPVVWDIETVEIIRKFESPPQTTGTAYILPSPEGFFVYGLSIPKEPSHSTGGCRYILQKWLTSSGELIKQDTHYYGDALAIFPQSGHLALMQKIKQNDTACTKLLVLNSQSMQVERSFIVPRLTKGNTLMISPDETVALTADPTFVWHLDKGGKKEGDDIYPVFTVLPFKTLAQCMLMYGSGAVILAGLNYGSLVQIDLAKFQDTDEWSNKELRLVKDRHIDQIWNMCMSVDQQYLVTASNDNTLKVIHIPTRTVTGVLIGHTYRVTCCAISANHKRVVSGSRDKTIRLWNAETSQELARIFLYEDIFDINFACNDDVIVALAFQYGDRRLTVLKIGHC